MLLLLSSAARGFVQRLPTSAGVPTEPRCHRRRSRQRRLAAPALRCLLGTGMQAHLSLHCAQVVQDTHTHTRLVALCPGLPG